MRIIGVLLVMGLLASCSSDNKSIPRASGMPGDMYLVMDSVQWKGPVGRTLDSIFGVEMPGLPRKEPIFKMRWINPRKLNFVLKQRRNLLFVMTLDQKGEGARIVQRLFTPASIEKIKNTPSQYSRNTADMFAKGQEVMFLYGKDEETLLRNLKTDAQRLVDFFNQKERERITGSIFKAGQVKGVSEALIKDFKCNILIPFGFKLADKKPDFVWLRQINPRDDRDVFIARKAYTSQNDFSKNNLIRFRDDICRKYLFEDPEQGDSYLLTETSIPFIPVTVDTVNFNNRFAVRLRGLWRTNTMGMGGPFQGFALVDEGTHQFYYIEGFTFSPGKDQREIMRELETILYTFKTSTELPARGLPTK
jgi:hypothetical protein